MDTNEELLSPQAVANQFLELAGSQSRPLTNIKLQKIVFIAHGFHLGALGRLLIYKSVYAWQFGPVFPTLYQPLRKFGNGEVTELLAAEDSVLANSNAEALIRMVWDSYGKMTDKRLSALTREKDSPWDLAWNRDGNEFRVIAMEVIRDHYHRKLKNALSPKAAN